MSQLTADISRKYKIDPDSRADQPVDAATVIYAGSMVGKNATTGYSRQLVGGDDFQGFADAMANNTVNPVYPNLTNLGAFIGAAGALNVGCRANGVLVTPASTIAGSPTIANVDQAVYASDGNTLTLAQQTTTITNFNGTGGTFTLTGNSSTGSAIAWNASAAAVVAGLPAGLVSQPVSVTGSAAGPWTLNWGPGVTPPTLTAGIGSLTGTGAAINFGTAALTTGQSKVGTIRNVVNAGSAYAYVEVKFMAVGEKVA